MKKQIRLYHLFGCILFVNVILCSCLLGGRKSNQFETAKVPYIGTGDTTAVVFLGRVVFDTTASRVAGRVLDRNTYLPIENAAVILRQGNREFRDTTDTDGNFAVFKDGFEGVWRMNVAHREYTCLQIDSVSIGGGQTLRIKLK